MTAFMEYWHRRLPRGQREPLPPRQITVQAARKAGVARHLTQKDRSQWALINHFAYGAATGLIYGIRRKRREALPPWLQGVPFGLGVWGVSYLGYLPLLRLYRPQRREPRPRQALMIAAHIVWGSALGALFQWQRSQDESVRVA